MLQDRSGPGPDTVSVAWEASPLWPTGPLPFGLAARRFYLSVALSPPVWADCVGRLRPGSALAFDSDTDGQRWTFTSASAEGARRLLQSWRAGAGRGDGVWTGLGPVAMRLQGDRGVTLEMARPSTGLPFADPRLGMSYSVAPAIIGSGGTSGVLMTYEPSDTFRTEVRVQEISDLRDAVDRSADVIVSRDPAVLRYGEGSGRYRVTPLTWDAVHVLVRPRAAATDVGASTNAGAEVLRFLAAGLRGEVREGRAPDWWSEACGSRGQVPAAAATPDSTLFYPEGDPLAADMAARLVALAVRGDSPEGPAGRSVLGDLPRRSEGVAVTELAARLESGHSYVLAALPTNPLNSCEAQAIWRDLLPSNVRAIPLIESRASVLIEDGPALQIVRTWDGLLRITSSSTGSP